MIKLILAALVGAVVFGLVIRNNPKLAKKLGVLADKLEEKIEEKLDKDI